MLFIVLTTLHYLSLASAVGALALLARHYWSAHNMPEDAPPAED